MLAAAERIIDENMLAYAAADAAEVAELTAEDRRQQQHDVHLAKRRRRYAELRAFAVDTKAQVHDVLAALVDEVVMMYHLTAGPFMLLRFFVPRCESVN